MSFPGVGSVEAELRAVARGEEAPRYLSKLVDAVMCRDRGRVIEALRAGDLAFDHGGQALIEAVHNDALSHSAHLITRDLLAAGAHPAGGRWRALEVTLFNGAAELSSRLLCLADDRGYPSTEALLRAAAFGKMPDQMLALVLGSSVAQGSLGCELVGATIRGDSERVCQLLAAGVDASYASDLPFLLACRHGHPALAGLYLEAGVRLDEEYTDPRTVLANDGCEPHFSSVGSDGAGWAAEQGQTSTLAFLASSRGLDLAGAFCLHCAVENGRAETARWLVKSGDAYGPGTESNLAALHRVLREMDPAGDNAGEIEQVLRGEIERRHADPVEINALAMPRLHFKASIEKGPAGEEILCCNVRLGSADPTLGRLVAQASGAVNQPQWRFRILAGQWSDEAVRDVESAALDQMARLVPVPSRRPSEMLASIRR